MAMETLFTRDVEFKKFVKNLASWCGGLDNAITAIKKRVGKICQINGRQNKQKNKKTTFTAEIIGTLPKVSWSWPMQRHGVDLLIHGHTAPALKFTEFYSNNKAMKTHGWCDWVRFKAVYSLLIKTGI